MHKLVLFENFLHYEMTRLNPSHAFTTRLFAAEGLRYFIWLWQSLEIFSFISCKIFQSLLSFIEQGFPDYISMCFELYSYQILYCCSKM